MPRDDHTDNRIIRKDPNGKLNESERLQLQELLEEGWTLLGQDDEKVVLKPPPDHRELTDARG